MLDRCCFSRLSDNYCTAQVTDQESGNLNMSGGNGARPSLPSTEDYVGQAWGVEAKEVTKIRGNEPTV